MEMVRKFQEKKHEKSAKFKTMQEDDRLNTMLEERKLSANERELLKIMKQKREDNIKLELDHIIPLDKGGSCMFNNFVIACARCNRSKSGRDVFFWCNLQGIGIPKIVLELLEKQKLN